MQKNNLHQNLSLIEFSKGDDEGIKRWNEFSSNCLWGDILQFWQWGELKKTEGWKPLRLQVKKENQVVLQVQFLLKKVKFLGVLAYAPHGPVADSFENLQIGLEFLYKELKTNSIFKREDIFALEIEPRLGLLVSDFDQNKNNPKYKNPNSVLAKITDSKNQELITASGFQKTQRNMQPKYKLYYDLEKSPEELLAQAKKSTRYNVKYATKKGVTASKIDLENEQINTTLENFYNLLLETQKRAKGYPIRSKKYFENLIKEFKNTQAVSFFEVKHENEVLGVNISEFSQNWSSSFYAGTSRNKSKLKAVYLLRFKSLMDAKERGCKIYDFWGIVPKSKAHSGYSDHKLSFGGEKVVNYGIFAASKNLVKFWIWNQGIKLYNDFAKWKIKLKH